MKKDVIFILLIITGLFFYPFGCTGQVNGNLPSDGCDTIYIEDPAWDAQVKTFEQTIKDLTEQNAILTDEGKNLNANIVLLQNSITTKDSEIKSLRSDILALEAELESIPDTVYLDKIVEVIKEVMPSPTVDTVYVSHSNDIKTNRKFFHHGSFDTPYPKNITFETKEFCMITVEFPDSLGTFRLLDKFKLKRIMDHENARTMYEFIE